MNITITQAASDKIAELLAEENNPAIRLRMYVQGGGCSGMSYGFAMDEEQNEDDWEVPAGETTVRVDSMSAQYLLNAKVDYVEDLMGASFKISNPQAQTTCGCGSSFNPF
jgi:iron-sulfur cluster insertion protein